MPAMPVRKPRIAITSYRGALSRRGGRKQESIPLHRAHQTHHNALWSQPLVSLIKAELREIPNGLRDQVAEVTRG